MAGLALGDRRGTWRHPPSFHVAGVALGRIHLRFTWQVWHLVTSTFVSRGRRGTGSHPHSFHVAGVALTALGGLWWRTGFSADAVDATALCVAGVALGDIHLHFDGRRGNFCTRTCRPRSPFSPPSAVSATPATQSEDGCHQLPRRKCHACHAN